MIFPKKPWDWKSCSEAVRKVKKLAESWAWTSLWSWRAVADLFIMFNDIARLKKLQKFINFCLKVGHSANLKHSKSTIRQLILLWKLQKHNPAQHFFIGRSSRGRLGTIDLRQLSFWYRVLSCEPTNYESVHTWVIHLLDCEQSLFGEKWEGWQLKIIFHIENRKISNYGLLHLISAPPPVEEPWNCPGVSYKNWEFLQG